MKEHYGIKVESVIDIPQELTAIQYRYLLHRTFTLDRPVSIFFRELESLLSFIQNKDLNS